MMTEGWKRTLAVGAISTLLLGGGGFGCFGSDDDVPDRVRRDTDNLSGVPDRARSVKEGSGELSYKVPADGRVYLYDLDNDTLRHTATVREGDRYTASIEDDVVAINGDRSAKVSLSSEHKHRLYFLASGNSNNDRYSDRDGDRRGSNGTVGRGVPDTAKLIAEERGGEISYKASTEGTAYLYNATDDRLVESFRLDDGQRLTISPADNAVSIDGKSVRGVSLDRRTTYRLLFDKR